MRAAVGVLIFFNIFSLARGKGGSYVGLVVMCDDNDAGGWMMGG